MIDSLPRKPGRVPCISSMQIYLRCRCNKTPAIIHRGLEHHGDMLRAEPYAGPIPASSIAPTEEHEEDRKGSWIPRHYWKCDRRRW